MGMAPTPFLLPCLLAQADPAALLLTMCVLLHGAVWHLADAHCLTVNAIPDSLGDATLCGAYISHIPMYESVAYFSFKRLTASLNAGCLGTTRSSLKAMVGSF